jgi:hypothetical protein
LPFLVVPGVEAEITFASIGIIDPSTAGYELADIVVES